MHIDRENELQFALRFADPAEGLPSGRAAADVAAFGNVQSREIVQLARCTRANFTNRINTCSAVATILARPLRYITPRCLPHISANEMEVPCVSTASSTVQDGPKRGE